MERLTLILAVALASYATRIAGFTLDRRAIPAPVDRALSYVPIAAFTALIIPGVDSGASGETAIRLAGLLVAALVIKTSQKLALSLAAGMACFLLLDFLTGNVAV